MGAEEDEPLAAVPELPGQGEARHQLRRRLLLDGGPLAQRVLRSGPDGADTLLDSRSVTRPAGRREDALDTLESLGWTEEDAAGLPPASARDWVPARVVGEARDRYLVRGTGETLEARLPGRMRHRAGGRDGLPAVGDWVGLRPPRRAGGTALIRCLLPRRTKLSRSVAGEREVEQILAANVDVAFVLSSLNAERNVRRIERYLALVNEGGIRPVVLLTKADLVDDPGPAREAVRAVAPGVEVLVLSALTGAGVEAVAAQVPAGRTAVLLGSSGVGKSTLANALLGEELLEVGEIREGDDKGRHTTTSRDLVRLPGGGLLIDTPGMRELQLWGSDAGVEALFAEITAVAAGCRFSDCRHAEEPGCAVREALATGDLPAERFESYRKLKGEVEARAQRLEEKRWRRKGRPRDAGPSEDEPRGS